MPGIWGRISSRARRLRPRTYGVEPLEGRVAPSSIAAAEAVHERRALEVEVRKEHREERIQAAHQARLDRYQAQYDAALASKPTVGSQVNFAYNTLRSAHKLVTSPNLPYTAWNFTKLSISHDTRKVGMQYLRAFFKGDGHTLDQLANTRLVKNVGQEYTNLSHSPDVKKISRGFTHFGDAVATQFDHLFHF